MRRTNFEQSGFLSQNSIDPNTLLPPCSLSVRNNAEKLEKELKFPISPAFVSIYKMNKDIKVQRAHDFCKEKNIPFSSEEHNFYRLAQSKKRFNQYSKSVNKCFETSRPSEIETGKKLMKINQKEVPVGKVTENFGDSRLYVPNVFHQAYKKQTKSSKAQSLRRNNNQVSSMTVQKKKGKNKAGGAPDTYGKLYEALENAHNVSKEKMISVFQEGEKFKADIIIDLDRKLANRTVVSPSKAAYLSRISSAEYSDPGSLGSDNTLFEQQREE